MHTSVKLFNSVFAVQGLEHINGKLSPTLITVLPSYDILT